MPGLRRVTWAIVIVATVAAVETARSQTAEEDEVFTADISIRQTHVNLSGQELPGAAPAANYRLEHRSGSRGTMTRLTLRELERDTAEGTAGPTELDNPFLAVRIELDAKSGLRMYNRRGERLREPTPADRRRFGIVNEPGSPNLPDGRALGARNRRANLLVKADRGRERRAELDRAFGPPAGRVRGFDRYVITRQDDVDEVLVDPSSVLPVELNTVRAGQLVSHVQMGYEATKGGVLVRKSFRSERSVPDGARRVVTSVDLSNVDVQAGGGQ